MGKKFYGVVFEGKFDVICGMLEGFMLGAGANWEWYSSQEEGIEIETFAELMKEWVTMKLGLHHMVMEEEFHLKLQKASKERGDMRFIKPKYTKSAREIKGASFEFFANAYAKEYADEIKAIIADAPAGITIEGFKPIEVTDPAAKRMELYKTTHSYSFKGEGTVKGEFSEVLEFRKKLQKSPLVKSGKIKLQF